MVDLELFKKLLSYDPTTGLFIWTDAHKVSTIRGKVAGSVSASPKSKKIYYEIAIKADYKRIRIKSHRLAWYFMTGHFPAHGEEIDHIDGNGANNSFSNLRLVDRAENCRNLKLRDTNKSGRIGVCWYKRDSTWQAEIKLNGERIFLGRFKNIEDAARARQEAELKYNFHQNHGSKRSDYFAPQYI